MTIKARRSQAMGSLDGFRWRTSSYTGDQGNCVEIGHAGDQHGNVIAIRDTKSRRGGALLLTAVAWTEFRSEVRTHCG
jgi:hypothetical protein